MDRGAWWATVHGVARVRHNWAADPSLQHLITSGRLFIFASGGSCLSWSPAAPLSTSATPPPVPSVHFTMNLTVLWDDASVLFSTDSLRGLNDNHRNNYSLSKSCVPGPFQSKITMWSIVGNVMQIVILAEKLSKFSALPIATKWISPLGVLRQKQ